MLEQLFKRQHATEEAASAEGGNGSGRNLIELHKVVKTFKTPSGDFTALRGVNLEVEAGEFVAVIGKSGSGKSTLINMLTGIDRPTAGEIFVGDTAVHALREGQIAQWRGRTIGIVFQFFQLLPTLTLVENIMLPMDFCNMYNRRERYDRAMELLALVHLTDHAHKLPTAISGGQQQRVAIARALANDPPILVADEPTGNLDSRTAGHVFEIFEGLIDQGKTIVMVTHDDDQAQRASRTIIIADGEVVNSYLARALPSLTQELLVKVTHKLEPILFSPGKVIIMQDTPPDKFYIITKGVVHVYLRHPDGSEILVDEMHPGQYFGEMALLQGGARTATVRASRSTEVEVVALDKEDFDTLLRDSVVTKTELDRVADQRRSTQARMKRQVQQSRDADDA